MHHGLITPGAFAASPLLAIPASAAHYGPGVPGIGDPPPTGLRQTADTTSYGNTTVGDFVAYTEEVSGQTPEEPFDT